MTREPVSVSYAPKAVKANGDDDLQHRYFKTFIKKREKKNNK